MADQNPIELTASDKFKFAAHVFSPRGRRHGAIVLLPDAFGATEDAMTVAKGYATDGFEVIVPQILDRAERNLNLPYDAAGIARGSGLASRLGFDTPMLDVAAAIQAISPHEPVAVLGFSWGASVAYVAAAHLPTVACAVCYYGVEIVKLLNNVPKVPLLMHFASRDATITKNNIDLVRHRNPNAELHVYTAQHGFNTKQRSTYDAAAARESRDRTLAFIEAHLASTAPSRRPSAERAVKPTPRTTSRSKR